MSNKYIFGFVFAKYDLLSQVLRAKGVVSILLLARHSTRWLVQACHKKFFAALEKLQRERSEAMQEMLHTVKQEIGSIVPVMLAQVTL